MKPKMPKSSEIPTNSIGSHLRIDDIYLPLNHLFSAASKKAFEQVVYGSAHSREVIAASPHEKRVVFDQVMYFGALAVGDHNIFDAAMRVANSVNECAKEGWVTGVLSKLVLYKLESEPHQLEQYAILSYVSMTEEGYASAKLRNFQTEFTLGGKLMEEVR